jgi:hypothetical protein
MTRRTLALTILATTLFACGDSGDTITLAEGFSAPHVVEGRAGGTTDASSLGADCIGNIASDPDHQLTLSADMQNLRIYARADEDITLVIQKPDGSYICNDDMEELNPLVTMPTFPAGTYKIWVGSYSTEDGGAAYKLAFSTDPAAVPSQLE